MASIIKVDQIQSDSGNVALTGNVTTQSTSIINFGDGQFVKDASGNVGIGTSVPAQRLHVKSSSNAVGVIQLGDTATTGYFSQIHQNGNDLRIIANGDQAFRVVTGTNDGTGQIKFFTAHLSQGNTERMRIASNGAQSSVIPGGSALYPEYKCRAWVNFNGTGTVAIRASGNVSSITDGGAGQYTVNFTTAMPDENYAVVSTGSDTSWGSISFTVVSGQGSGVKSTTQVRVDYAATGLGTTNNRADSLDSNICVFR